MLRLPTLLILAILGHGLLMAGGTELPRHAESAAPALSWVAGVPPTAESSSHQEKCFTVQTAIKFAAPRLPAAALGLCLPGAAPDVVIPAVARITPPQHPPDTIRALLQVYRI